MKNIKNMTSACALLLMVCSLTAQEPAKALIEPAIEQRVKAAELCISAVPADAARPAGVRFCLKNALDRNSFERLVAVQFSFDGVDKSLSDAIAALIAARNDKQIGSAPESGGTTSLATKGYAPRILSLAVEQGAISRQIDKNIVTFRATPAGMIDAVRKVDLAKILALPVLAAKSVPAIDSGAKPLPPWTYRLSMSVSFDTNRSGQQNVLLANRQQISSWGGRFIIVNTRDAAQSQYTANWARLAAKESTDFYIESKTVVAQLEKTVGTEMGQVLSDLNKKVDTTFTDDMVNTQPVATVLANFQTMVRSAIVKLVSDLKEKDPTVASGVRMKTLKPFFEAETDLYTFVNRGMLMTADYSVSRDPLLPDLSTLNFVLENGLGKGRRAEFTLNAGANFYNSTSTAVTRRFHSFKVTSQLDYPLGKFAVLGPFILTLAGRYQDIPKTTLTPGSEVIAAMTGDVASTGTAAVGSNLVAVTPQGRVGIGQIKLTIPVKDSGVRIPFSFSFSHRAGLVQERYSFSATVGMTFDLDALIGKSAAKK